MKYIIVSFLLVFFFSLCSESPKKIDKIGKEIPNNLDSINKNIGVLIYKLKSADSVVLVSHIDNNMMITKDKYGKEKVVSVALCDSIKPNNDIIKERKKINKTLVDTLSLLLSRKPTNDSFVIMKCFEPHHTIFIFKNSKLSFVDICFTCQQFCTSADLKNTIDEIENKKWRDLKQFYKSLDFKYEID